MRIFRFVGALLIVVVSLQPVNATAAYDPCDYPLAWDYNADYEFEHNEDGYGYLTPPSEILKQFCKPFPWEFENFNDGFDKYLQLSMDPYQWPPDEYDSGCYTWKCTVNIFCVKKKISVELYIGPADAVGWSGSGKVKFDNGVAKTMSYSLFKDLDGVALKDPKSFMQSLVKAKEGFGVKFRTRDGKAYNRTDKSLLFPKGDLMKYRPVFAKAGCKF